MGTMKLLPLLVLCVSLPTPSKSALKAFDCPPKPYWSSRSVPIYDLLPKCENIRHSEWIYAALVERPSAIISAYRCRVTYIQSLVDLEGSSRPVSNGTEELGRDTCLKAHLSKAIELMGEFIPHLNVNGTTRHAIPKISADVIEGNTSSETRTYSYHRSYEITLSREQGTLQWHQNILRFDGIDCDYDSFTCGDDFYGQLFWKPGFDGEADIPKLYSGWVALVSMEKTRTTPDVTFTVIGFEDKILAVRGLDNVTNDGKMAFRSEVENVYIMPQFSKDITFDHEIIYSQYYPETHLPGSPKSALWKNVYAEEAYSRFLEEKFNAVDVVKRLCEAKKIKLFRYLESLKPWQEVDFPLKRLIGTKKYDKHFVIQTCTENVVYRRKSNQCFKEMTVTNAGNVSMFLDPYTRKLTSHAVEMDCNSVPQNNVTSAESPLEGPSVSLQNSISASTTGCSDFDWVKIVALALLSIWI